MDSTCKPPEETSDAALSRVAEALATELLELENISLKLKEARLSLAEFLGDYLQRVGPLIEQLRELEKQRDRLRSFAAPPPEATASIPTGQDGFQKELKRLYRDLAKACHPDQAGFDGSYMQVVNHAYQQRNLASLWKLALKILPSREAETLEHRLQDIKRAKQAAATSLEALEQSPDYQLMQRVFVERLRGRDLVYHIERDLENQLRQTERRLLLTQWREEKSADA
jgi:hypothetical protein